jgi:hypothetical protein
MLVVRQLTEWCESTPLARERDAVIRQQLIHAQRVRAHNGIVGNHDRLVTVANVIRKDSPFAIAGRTNDEHWFLELDHADDTPFSGKHKAIVLLQDRASPERRGKFETAVRSPPGAGAQPFLPAQGQCVGLERTHLAWQAVEGLSIFDDRR